MPVFDTLGKQGELLTGTPSETRKEVLEEEK
jgi:ATP-dependent DNA ligase